jgi:hypothetical protein
MARMAAWYQQQSRARLTSGRVQSFPEIPSRHFGMRWSTRKATGSLRNFNFLRCRAPLPGPGRTIAIPQCGADYSSARQRQDHRPLSKSWQYSYLHCSIVKSTYPRAVWVFDSFSFPQLRNQSSVRVSRTYRTIVFNLRAPPPPRTKGPESYHDFNHVLASHLTNGFTEPASSA